MNCPRCDAELIERRVSEMVTRLECPDEDCHPTGPIATLRRVLAWS